MRWTFHYVTISYKVSNWQVARQWKHLTEENIKVVNGSRFLKQIEKREKRHIDVSIAP
jgi:hypothetical protein